MKKVLLILLFFTCFVYSTQLAYADDTPKISNTKDDSKVSRKILTEDLNVKRWYKVYWAGIHIANLLAQSSGNKIDALIDSRGIVKKVSKFSSDTSTVFNFDGNSYTPVSFHTKFRLKNKTREINIEYDESGTITKDSVVPPDRRSKRPAVPESMKKNTFDPLTSFMKARYEIKNNLAKGQNKFTIDMYDGRRLSKLNFEIVGKFKDYNINNVKRDVIKAYFKRESVAGYTSNELRRAKKEEPLFTLYISDDEYFLPIKVDAKAPLGSVVILFEKECEALEECIE